jgi:hypothetical protein
MQLSHLQHAQKDTLFCGHHTQDVISETFNDCNQTLSDAQGLINTHPGTAVKV